jgi:hypothetical protein
MLRHLLGAILAVAMMAGVAAAAEAEGQIQEIDKDNLTITLSDGKSYKLPGEFDVDALQEGMDVILAYDEVGGENLITDMEISQ